jgi:hypothetical protein
MGIGPIGLAGWLVVPKQETLSWSIRSGIWQFKISVWCIWIERCCDILSYGAKRMPRPETFMDRQIGDRRVRVLKVYDRAYARDVLAGMNESARACLWKALRLDEEYEPGEIPPMNSTDAEDILWDALLEDSREDGNLCSFFVVAEDRADRTDGLYVSPDWPSSEEFANTVISDSVA